MLISTSLSSLICSWLASRCSQRSPSQQRFPWALQLKDQILKEQITDDHVFFKMPFRPCPSGCGHCLSADDGHDRCLQCLGFQHAEDAFVDDSCAFLKGLAPSAALVSLAQAEDHRLANVPSGSRMISLVRPTGRQHFIRCAIRG